MTQATYIFKLRHNIPLEGDLQLARRELDAFLGNVEDLPTLFPSSDFSSLLDHTCQQEQQGYRAEAIIEQLPTLIRRLSFVQRIYCICADTSQALEILQRVSAVTSFECRDGNLLIEAIPHYALLEYADVITRRAKSPDETKRNLALLLDALLNRSDDKRAHKLADMALSAHSTMPLSHGIHYYKARFFPRMARSVLNIYSQQMNTENPQVFDPFVGSGTTLLEASLLGMESAGIDVDPLSVLISQTKMGVLELDEAFVSEQVDIAIERLSCKYKACPVPTNHSLPDLTFPDWLMKNRRMTTEQARLLIDEIDTLRGVVVASDPMVHDLFKVLMSDAIARRIRMRFLGTGVGRFSLTFSKTPLTTLFIRSAQKYAKLLAAWEWLRETLGLKLADAKAIQGDARQMDRTEQVDLLLTSPPYLPAASGRESYAKARAPSLLALDMADVIQVDALVDAAVGSMDLQVLTADHLTNDVQKLVTWLQQDELRTIKAEPTARYFLDMRQAFVGMRKALRPGGMAVVVSSRQSTFYRYQTREVLYTVPVAEMLAEEAQIVGLEVVELIHIPLNKSNRNARPRSLDSYDETLIVLRKG